MEDGAGRQNRESDLASIEQCPEQRYLASELSWIRGTYKSYDRRRGGLIKERHDHQKREANADGQSPPSGNRK